MIFSDSSFLYGPEVNENSLYLDFNEGGALITGELVVGGYTLSTIGAEVQRVLNKLGSLEYIVTTDRTLRKITISANGNFSLLFATGVNPTLSISAGIGFSSIDLTGGNSYTSDLKIATAYNPQFKLQNYVALENWQDLTASSKSESASGVIEVLSFAKVNFMQCNITFANDYDHYGPIQRNINGVNDLREFMKYIVKKLDVEFIPDRYNAEIFSKVLLEKTPISSRGVGFKLKELYGKGLAGYFETGNLKFREVST